MRPTANVPVVSLRELSPEAALARLELTVGRRIDGLANGDHAGFGLGPGTEAADARIYVPGQDDVRRIDWNVTARTGEVHVRDVTADRELGTWALVDATASMDFGTATMEKRDLAAAVTVSLARTAARTGDQFGAHVLTADGVRRFPHRSGRAHRLMVLRSLAEAPRQGHAESPGLAAGIASLERHRRRGLRFVVSDLMDPDRDAWARALRRLTTRQRVVVVEVLDPRELDLPDVGVVTFADPETGATHDVDTSSRRTRRRFAEAAREERAANAAAVRGAGADHLVVSTGGDWLRDLTRFVLQARHRRTSSRPLTEARP
ncbi:DUF58 domain-containing protein [Solicola sp. PLA-1-18]|uniref:DUF58 domain-containing protein n=1 Tax=Solicola sp. PLA-1-18 TaxID=3380532 RepID=UPI003B7E134F